MGMYNKLLAFKQLKKYFNNKEITPEVLKGLEEDLSSLFHSMVVDEIIREGLWDVWNIKALWNSEGFVCIYIPEELAEFLGFEIIGSFYLMSESYLIYEEDPIDRSVSFRPSSYRLQPTCKTCKHVFRYLDYEETEYYCHIDKSERPLSGSIDERFDYSAKDYVKKIHAWEKWSLSHFVEGWGCCDNYEKRRINNG